MRALARLNRFLERACEASVTVIVPVMLAVMAAQVFLRYVFNVSLSWSEELTLTLFCWTVMLMGALGVKQGLHVRMSVFIERLRGRARVRAERLIHLATAGLGGFLGVSAWRYVAETRGTTSAAIGYPIGVLYASALVCGVLIALFALEALLAGRVPADEGEPERHAGV